MWTRKQLKDKGKASFRANYWKCVLVALVLAAIAGGSMSVAGSGDLVTLPGAAGGLAGRFLPQVGVVTIDGARLTMEDADDLEDALELLGEKGVDVGDLDKAQVHIDGDTVEVTGEDGAVVRLDEDGVLTVEADGTSVRLDGSAFALGDSPDPLGLHALEMAAIILASLLVALVAIAIAFALRAFLLNPVEVGGRRFFTGNLNRAAEVKELAYAYDHEYLTGVKTMFLRDLFTFLWTLLLVVPGIVKSYEYRMIPYLIADDPTLDYKQAFARSKQLMHGQKWRAFVLDLSFVGWWLLSALTLGLLGVFYVAPYHAATSAALYEAIRYGEGGDAALPVAPVAASAPVDMSEQPAWATTPEAASEAAPEAEA